MKTHLNLLPIAFLRARLLRRRLALWSPVWALVAVVGVTIWWSERFRCSEACRAQYLREREFEPLARQIKENATMKRQIEELEKRELILDDVDDRHPPLTAVGIVSRCAARCDERLRVEKFVLERNRGASPSPTSLASVAGGSLVTLEGKGADNLAVAAFAEALRNTSAFVRVDLKSTIRSGSEIDDMRHFVITCEF